MLRANNAVIAEVESSIILSLQAFESACTANVCLNSSSYGGLEVGLLAEQQDLAELRRSVGLACRQQAQTAAQGLTATAQELAVDKVKALFTRLVDDATTARTTDRVRTGAIANSKPSTKQPSTSLLSLQASKSRPLLLSLPASGPGPMPPPSLAECCTWPRTSPSGTPSVTQHSGDLWLALGPRSSGLSWTGLQSSNTLPATRSVTLLQGTAEWWTFGQSRSSTPTAFSLAWPPLCGTC